MEQLWSILNQVLLIIELFAALIGLVYFFKLKHSYWRWFGAYLVFIFIQEFFWTHILPPSLINYKNYYFLLLGIPIQFIFLYWLYALKSLKNRKLFVISVSSFLLAVASLAITKDSKVAQDLSKNIGTLFLVILIILEYMKQIRNDNILNFKKSKMFYINLGAILFYIGSYPFEIFQKLLYKDYQTFVEYYYVYFIVANCAMYLLFIASFIWGKEQSS